MSTSMKIPPVGAELFNADRRAEGRTDMTKLIVAFSHFANAPKNELKLPLFLKIDIWRFCLFNPVERVVFSNRMGTRVGPRT